MGPIGSLIYQSSATGTTFATEADTYSISLEAGQKASFDFSPPSSGWSGTLSVAGPAGAVFDSGPVSLTSGNRWFKEDLTVPTSGVYTFRINTVTSGSEAYRASLHLNTTLEDEAYQGAANDSVALAEPLDNAALNLGGIANSRLAVQGTIQGTPDYYSFTGIAAQSTDIVLASSAVDTKLDLFDSQNRLVASGIKSGPDGVTYIQGLTPTATGPYYVRVMGATAGNYSIVVTRSLGFEAEPNNGLSEAQAIGTHTGIVGAITGVPLISAETEPNDDGATGGQVTDLPFANDLSGSFVPIGSNQYRAVVTGVVSSGSDNGWDFFKVLAGPGDTLVVDMEGSPTSAGTLSDPYLYLYNSSATRLIADDDGGVGYNSHFSYNFTASGEYYIVADSYSSTTGSYRLTAVLTTQNPRVGIGSDDYYSVYATNGSVLEIRTATPGIATGNSLDPKLEVYSPSGALVASDANGAGDGRNALISYAAAETGRYVIKLSGGGTRGDYVLSVAGRTAFADSLHVASITPSNGALLNARPSSVEVSFNQPLLLTSIAAGDLTVNGVSAGSVNVVDGDTLLFDISNAVTADGIYTIVLGGGAIQGLSGTASEFFLSTFDADATGPVVVSSSIAEAATIAPGDVVYQVTLSEPINTLNLGVEDLVLSPSAGGSTISPTSLLVSGNGTVITATFPHVAEGDYRMTLLSGAQSVRDLRGNLLDGAPSWPLPSGGGPGGDNFVINFSVDAATVAFPTPLNVSRPVGGFVYDRSLSARIGNPGDTDRYTLNVEARQLITLALNPDANLKGIIELRDSAGTVVASASSSAMGAPALIQSALANTGGEYAITVTSADGSLGAYNLRLVLNASLESESFGGAANNSLAAAESLSATALSVLNGTSRLATIGRSSGEDDYFRFTAATGQIVTVTAAPIAGSVQLLELYSSSGARLAAGLLDDEGVSQNIRTFIAPANDDYLVRIRGLGTTEYALAVLVGSDIDVETNDDRGKPQFIDGSSTLVGGLQIGGGEVAIDFSDNVGSLNLEGFSTTGLWHVTDQRSGPAEGHSGPAIAYFGSDATGTFDLGTVSGTLTSPPVALRGGTSPTLSFSYRLQGETSTSWDRAFVRVSTNGGQSWETVASKATILSQSLTWRRVSVDLSSYAGQTVLLQYLFESGDSISNNFLGWQIDDISITGVQDVQDHYAFFANDGDHLVIAVTTPGDAAGEPTNALDARIELYNASGLLIATDDNSASDGRNPRLEFTVPAGQGGQLTARLTSLNSGNYTLAIGGSTAANVLPPKVTSVVPQNGQQLAAAPASLLFTFSEAVRVDTVTAGDLVFADPAVSVSAVEFVDGRHVRFTLNIPQADGVYDYSIAAGSVLDLQGLGNVGFSGSFNVDRDGPRVIGTSPSLQASAPFSQIRFVFDEPLDPAAVSVADVVAFSGPNGNLLAAITGVEVIVNELIVRFQSQVTPGLYALRIGPNVTDLVGNLMNQDQDDVNGEASDDQYAVTLNLQSPDLIVETPQAVASATFGQTVTVQYGVRNVGNDPALEGWYDAIYLSTDAVLDRNDLRLTSVPAAGTFGPLDAAGGAVDRYTRAASVTLPLNETVVSGTYYLIVVADDGADQPESSETNNAAATSAVAIATPPSVDLRVTSIVAPVEALSGQPIPIRWTITNTGAADFTGTFRDQVYLSADTTVGGDQFFGNFDFTGTIPAGGSVTRVQQITLPLTLADDRYVIVRTDSNNSVFELGGENNNTLVDDAIIDVRLSPFPNLQVTDVIAPPSAFSDQSAVIEWIVTNNGNGPTNAPSWTDRVYLSTDQVFDASDTLLGGANNPAFLAAGDSYRSSLTVTLPRGIDDNYYFLVRTDVANEVNELNSESDNTGVSDATDVQLTPPPDLRVTTIQAPAASFSGQSVMFNWTVTNAGPGATRASAWSDRVYFSADNVLDATDTLLTTVGHSGALDPGASYSSSGTGILPIGVAGNFYFIVQTDAFNNIFEHVFEGNNTGFDTPPTLVTLTPPPDLAVEAVDAPAMATSSRSLTVNYRVTNFGATETPNTSWNDRLFLSVDNIFDSATDLQIATRTHLGSLEPGETYNESFSTTLSNTIVGSYFVIVVTDFGNTVFEIDNANNTGFDAVPLAIVSRPANLSVASFTGPSVADAGDSFLLNWIVQNIGVGDTAVSSWFDRVVLSNDIVPSNDDLILASVTHSGLLNPAGNYTVNNQLVQLPFSIAPGSYFLLLTTDAGNNVYESTGEANNLASPLPIVISRDESDLRLTSVAASGSAQSGGSLTVNWTVLNDSPVTTNANFWFDQVYLSTNNVIDDSDTLLGTVQRSNALAPHAQYSMSRDFTLPQNVSGQFFIIVRTDASNLVVEGPFENNNDRSTAGSDLQVGLSRVPDLAVTNVNAPADGFSGQPFQLSWTVSNHGQEATNDNWYDSAYLSLDQVFDRASDTYLGFANRPNNLAVGTNYTQTQSFTIPAGFAGQYYVFVVADGNDRVFERGAELNNTGLDPVSMHVTLTPPADFIVGSITVPANGIPGQTATISYTVVNQGVNAAVGSWVDSIYLSADDVWDVNDPLVHRSTRNGPVAGGTSYTESFTAPLPGVVPGDYHVIIRSDILNRIPESNEGNNIGVSLNQAALDFQELELGVAATGNLSQGRTAYYKVTVPAGETLSFLLDSNLGDGANEVYVGFERVPTRSDYHFAAIEPFEVDQRALVPSTQAGTYFVAVYANNLFSQSQLYELKAELLDFDVFDTDYGRGGNVGDLTIEINGAKFDRTVTARIVDGNGVSHAARQMWYVDEVVAYATFDLRGFTPGIYDVAIGNSAGASITVTDGLQVVSSTATAVIPRIDAPSTVRRGSGYAFTVSWGNDGLNDVPAPFLLVGNSVPFGRSPGGTELGTRYFFLANGSGNAPSGILRPGQSGAITFFSYSDNSPGTHTAFVDRIFEDLAPFDWSGLRNSLRPATMSDADFEPVFQRIISQVGLYNRNYLEMLSRNASLVVGSLKNDPDELIRIELEKALAALTPSISGKIEVEDVSVGIAARRVLLRGGDTERTYTTETLADGSFIFNQLRPGHYVIEIEGLIVDGSPPERFVGPDSHISDANVVATSGAAIVGHLIDASNHPVPAAVVQAYIDGELASTGAANATGDFVIAALRPGTYTLVIRPTDLARAWIQNVVVDLDRIDVGRITLVQGADLTGNLVLSNGQPLRDGEVVLERTDGLPFSGFSTIATNGEFTLSHLPLGTYSLSVLVAGDVRKRVQLIEISRQTVNVGVVELEDVGTINGVVGHEANVSIRDLQVAIYKEGNAVGTSQLRSDGSFRLENVPVGVYTIHVVGLPDGTFAAEQQITISSGQVIDNVSLLIMNGASLTGMVLAAGNGTALSGIIVDLIDAAGKVATLVTSADGFYSFGGLRPGNYRVLIPGAGSAGIRSVEIASFGEAHTGLDLTIDVSSRVSGTVSVGGNTISGATIVLYHDGRRVATAATDEHGYFAFAVFNPGAYVLQASYATASFAPMDVDVTEDADVNISIASGTASVEIIVQSPDGLASRNAQLSLLTTFGGILLATSDANGIARFVNLAAGNYEVRIEGADSTIGSRNLTVVPNSRSDITVLLEQGFRVVGTIESATPGLALNKIVELHDVLTGNLEAITSTNESGSFQITGVHSGTYQIVVYGDGVARQATSAFLVASDVVQHINVIGAQAFVVGRVLIGGVPLPNARVTALAVNGNVLGSVTSSFDGTFSLPVMPDNPISLRVSADGMLSITLSGISTLVGLTDAGDIELNEAAIPFILSANINNPNAPNVSHNALVRPSIVVARAPEVAALLGFLQDWFFDLLDWISSPDLSPEHTERPAPLDGDCKDCLGKWQDLVDAVGEQDRKYERVENTSRILTGTAGEYYSRITLLTADAAALVTSAVALIPAVSGAGIAAPTILGYSGVGVTVGQGLLLAARAALDWKGVVGDFGAASSPSELRAAAQSAGTAAAGTAAIIVDTRNELIAATNEKVREYYRQWEYWAKNDPAYLQGLDYAGEIRKVQQFASRALGALNAVLFVVNAYREITTTLVSLATQLDQLRSDYDREYREYESAAHRAKVMEFRLDGCLSRPCDCESPNCDDDGDDDGPDDEEEIERPAARDPNDILGPSGFGPENWTAAAQPLNYTIRFENDPIFATAPAQVVRITQQLDSDLDFRTFRVGNFAVGTHFVDVPSNRAIFQERLDLRNELGIFVDVFAGIDVTTGEAFWEFTSIDPATGEQPVDALAGLLPPNLISPEGEGFVTYSVRPRSTATTGTVIDAAARIIFDVNEPIDTPSIFNTLDVGLPVSSVSALPMDAEASTFAVSWSGLDAEGGSGLAGIDVYISENNGPYQIFLANTALTSAEFIGQPNRRYAFYSVARDNAGNIEGAPVTPDAVTLTPAPVDATPPVITGAIVQAGLTQRSYVDRLVVNFSEQVNLASLISNGNFAGAIKLTNRGVNAPAEADQQITLMPGQFLYEFDEMSGVSRLTWSLNQFLGTQASLPDGQYEFSFDAGLVTDLAGNLLDGNGDGTAGGNYVLSFHRLSGDANGDRTVDTSDMTLVNAALGSRPGVAAWNANADLDRDGFVTTRDRVIVAQGTGHAIVSPTRGDGLAGDYNQDGAVDAADYVIWRRHLGTSGAPLSPGDGDASGTVNHSDFLIWRSDFGNSAPQIGESTQGVAVTFDVASSAAASPASMGLALTSETIEGQQAQSQRSLADLALAADPFFLHGLTRVGERPSNSTASHPLFPPNSPRPANTDIQHLKLRSKPALGLELPLRYEPLADAQSEVSQEIDAAVADLFGDAAGVAVINRDTSRLHFRLAKAR